MRRLLMCQENKAWSLLSVLLMIALGAYPALGQEKTAAEKLQSADNLSIEAVKIAARVRENCDCGLLQKGLGSANEAAVLLSEVAAEAENTGSMDLAQQACDMVINVVGAAVAFIKETCTYCLQTSPELETVECFKENYLRAEEIGRFNNETVEATLTAGAVTGPPEPFVVEPEARGDDAPVEDEPPIQDHEQPPASTT